MSEEAGESRKIEPISDPVAGGMTRQIADSIRASILAGELKIDERLPTEHELAAMFNVSRPTIREALKRLAAQYLIRSKRGPGGGVFVNRPNLEQAREGLSGVLALLGSLGSFSLVDIAEVRHEFGMICLRHAMQRRTNDDLAALEKQLLLMEDPSLPDTDFCAADVGFHRALADATGNGVLAFSMHFLLEALMPPANMVVFKFRERKTVTAYHRSILLAVHARNQRAGEEAFEGLMDYLRSKYAEAQTWRCERDQDHREARTPQE
ncbi:GntR family transcriptional regulator [Geminicoccaceae bacterium 1502E]|nr:GntR family transcriptional regulator [Geminicoccaceae bacterium 1502E]